MCRQHLTFILALLLAVSWGPVAWAQGTAPGVAVAWRIDATGTFVCPPLDRSLTMEQAAAAKNRQLVFGDDLQFAGSYLMSEAPPGPCHAPDVADQLDRQSLPVCPPVDRTISQQQASTLREPSMRIKRDLYGRYEGVMHDVPDGPCRPRAPEEADLPVPPRCAVYATAALLPQSRMAAIPGASAVEFADGMYVGAFVPVSCAIHHIASPLYDYLNQAAMDAASTRLQESIAERHHQDLLAAVRALQRPSPSVTVPNAMDAYERFRAERVAESLRVIGFSLSEISAALTELNWRALR